MFAILQQMQAPAPRVPWDGEISYQQAVGQSLNANA